MHHFFTSFRLAIWRAFQHNAFAVAKAAAYSSVMTLFPGLIIVATLLAGTHQTEKFVRQLSYAMGIMLPPGTSTAAMAYFEVKTRQSTHVVVTAVMIMLTAASGVIISWMEGFRAAYGLRTEWGFWHERGMAILLVVLSFVPMTIATVFVAFGYVIENWLTVHLTSAQTYVFVFWTGLRWLIAFVTTVAVVALIYHLAIPRTQKWYRVLPGATLAAGIWFPTTMLFGWYVGNYASYNAIYGPLGAAIALLVWMYINSIIVLVGAEFNALFYPAPAPAALKVNVTRDAPAAVQ